MADPHSSVRAYGFKHLTAKGRLGEHLTNRTSPRLDSGRRSASRDLLEILGRSGVQLCERLVLVVLERHGLQARGDNLLVVGVKLGGDVGRHDLNDVDEIVLERLTERHHVQVHSRLRGVVYWEERSGHETEVGGGDEKAGLGAAGNELGDHMAGNDARRSQVGGDLSDDVGVRGRVQVLNGGELLQPTVYPDGVDVVGGEESVEVPGDGSEVGVVMT